MIDYRSDTVTKPGPGMLAAISQARVGDDVFGEDPTINQLESKAATLFGMEAGIFCPSGTMTNQIAIKCHTQPGDEVICDESAHVYQYEGGGIASNSGASVKLITGNLGRVTAEQVAQAINPVDDHKAHSSLVCLENTSNRGGGSCYDLNEIKKIARLCRSQQLQFHLDGARLWNALVARREMAYQYGEVFDSISICLSKSLGCPAGSLLLGRQHFIRKARRVRKAFGGGMRQAGFLAAAGIYALDHNIERLAIDHEHARRIGEVIQTKKYVKQLLPVETNIIIFELNEEGKAPAFVAEMKNKGFHTYAITPSRVRMVTHLDISEEMVNETIKILQQS